MKRLFLLAALCLALCACAAVPAGTTLPNETTLPVHTTVPVTTAPPETTGPLSILIRIDDPETYIYEAPALCQPIVQMFGETGVYTIVEEAVDIDGNIWGRLKSGLGWICLTDPPLVPIHADYAEESFNAYHTYWCGETEYLTSIGFTSTEPLTDVKFGLLDWFETESFTMPEVLYTIDSMDPSRPFLAQVVFWGDLTTYGISFTDESGEVRHFAVSISGKDGSVFCKEYLP